MTTTKNPVSAFFLAIALAGCSSPSPQTSSSSNWVVCSVDQECAALSSAFKCEDGYCVDSKNGRVEYTIGSGDPSSVVAAASNSPPLNASEFLADAGSNGQGVLITISGSLMEGTYELTELIEGPFGRPAFPWSWDFQSPQGQIDIDVIGPEPAKGVESPVVNILLNFATADDGLYPGDMPGHCSFAGLSGAGLETSGLFACEDLVGIGSGQPFSLSGALHGLRLP